MKFWPVMLLPLIWRRYLDDWRRLLVLAAVFLPFALLAIWPQFSAGLDRDAGVVAYSTTWSRNSALFPVLESVMAFFAGAEHASSLTRAGLVAAIVGAIGYLAWSPVASLDDLVSRTTLAIGALLLLSPAQYPWYVVWLMPFLALYPVCGFLVLPRRCHFMSCSSSSRREMRWTISRATSSGPFGCRCGQRSSSSTPGGTPTMARTFLSAKDHLVKPTADGIRSQGASPLSYRLMQARQNNVHNAKFIADHDDRVEHNGMGHHVGSASSNKGLREARSLVMSHNQGAGAQCWQSL